jgi:hypothetical protein
LSPGPTHQRDIQMFEKNSKAKLLTISSGPPRVGGTRWRWGPRKDPRGGGVMNLQFVGLPQRDDRRRLIRDEGADRGGEQRREAEPRGLYQGDALDCRVADRVHDLALVRP